MAEGAENGDPQELTRSGVGDIPRIPLTDVTDGPRFAELDKYEQHFRLTQDDDKLYDWNGYFRGFGPMAAIKPGWYVPLSMRKPSAMMPLAKFIVGRLTSMTLGVDSEPVITCEGDEDAEAYTRALCEASQLFVRGIEARDIGGACGSVAMSYGFVEGAPRVEVHNPKHCRVLEWVDRAELRVGSFLKCYAYTEEELDEKTGRPVETRYFYARFIDSTRDLVWTRITEEQAEDPNWSTLVEPDRAAEVIGGVCPVIWIQNHPHTSSAEPPRAPYDGPSDYEGMCDDLCQIHRLKSATTKGTIANVDPTLVVKEDKSANRGSVRTGSNATIYARGGAEYLYLPGDSMEAAEKRLQSLRTDVLDASGVVAPPAEEVASAAKSAAALRIIFAPMTSVCSVLRASYGSGFERVLVGLLKMARALGADAIDLPKKFERLEPPELEEGEEESEEPAEAEIIEIKLVPGESEQVRLIWPPFFSPTWTDKQIAVQTAKDANGGKSVISHRTAVRSVAQLFGVEDPDSELDAIEDDADRGLDREIQALGAMNGPPGDDGGTLPKPNDDDDGEKGAGARADGGPGTKKPEADGG
ncbi:MAG TPA: hypothetical protein ENK57_11995 [Polyangiaceae bacterium]|nr:hypothetical protein [Polyangiaceae bacterium]